MYNIILAVGFALIIAIIVIKHISKNNKIDNQTNNYSITEETDCLPSFSFEIMPESEIIDENKLIEINDKHLLAKIDNVIPNAGRAVQNLKAADALNKTGELYQVIIPQGANLDHSRAMEGALRATFRDVPNNIQGQANLVKADCAVLASQGANVANAVMNVGSMVVGQYYMSEINNKLEDINSSIKSIDDFQNDEYKSKIMALGADVKKISEYEAETLEKEEVRKRTLDKLGGLESEAIQLLGQANLKLERYNKTNIDFKEYEKQTKEADIWYWYQQILMSILYEIDNLTYTLYMGMEPKEKCFKLFNEYNGLSENVLVKLNHWHENVANQLQIDIDESKRRREGFKWLANNFDVINDWDLTYKTMNGSIVKMITNQSSGTVLTNHEDNDLFQNDVRLIKKEGKIYYYPQNN